MTEQGGSLLSRKAPLALAMARAATASNPQHAEDAAQEALIALWQVSREQPDASEQYLHGVMRTRVLSVVRGDRLTGQASRQGRAINAETVPLDNAADFLDLLAASDLLHDVEMAYHRGEIAHALDLLSRRERDYVILRFWCDYTPGEIMSATGLGRATMDSYWSRARTKLREALPHLADAY